LPLHRALLHLNGGISTKRSTSRGSIANGVDAPAAGAGIAPLPAATAAESGATIVSAYGAMSSTVDAGYAGQGYGGGGGGGGGMPDWNDSRYGGAASSDQSSSPPTYGSLQ